MHAALGDNDQAFEWLEKAYRDRDTILITNVRGHHRFAPLRSDPRYADLLRRMNLPQ
ncbi:MAG: TPR end-of-group domain-containing protein [Terriglobales bacterium]